MHLTEDTTAQLELLARQEGSSKEELCREIILGHIRERLGDSVVDAAMGISPDSEAAEFDPVSNAIEQPVHC